MKVIIVTGTPCTGKTTVAKEISKLGYKYLDVNKIIDDNKLCEEFDKERDCKVVDENKLNKILKNIIEKSKEDLVIDSHMSHFVDPSLVNVCIVTTCNLKDLKKRLADRDYSDTKIVENMEAETMGVCFSEAKEIGHKCVLLDTSKPYKLSELI